jgi:hypothetical protein
VVSIDIVIALKPLHIILNIILDVILNVIVEATSYSDALKWMDLDIHSASG